MAVSVPAVHEALADLVGRAHCLREAAALAAYAVDGMAPSVVVRPGRPEEVSGVLALCAAERLAVMPRGAGTSVGLGNPPRRLDVVLELRRLGAVREYVPEDMVATVEAGATLDALSAHFGPQGQLLALDPPGGAARSVGGVLATHASGPLRFRYGTGRDLLLGVRFAQADGTLTWGGAKVVKSVTGYDVPKLLVGSLGTLGVIVEATLRLQPAAPARRSWRLGFPSRDAAGAFVAALLDSTIEPDRAALLDRAAQGRAGLEVDPLAVLLSIGSAAAAVEHQGQALARLAAGHGGRSEAVPEQAWAGLDAVVQGPILLRAAGEPRRLVHWTGEARTAAERAGVEPALLGQPGHGVLQIALGEGAEPGRVARDLIGPLRQALEAEGGSLVVERAPLELKKLCDVWGSIDTGTLAIMSRIKGEFDPAELLNPGRFVGGL
ncbi:MAG TPA: FAD-binding oxidoreductase [Methylomirabilota bacterium]|nr:FAD-binding oxidoreductase [Methylomirabilota bacterium]